MYERIIFLEEDGVNAEDAADAFRFLKEEGEQAAVQFLASWHYPGEHETADEPSAGTAEDTYETEDGYILTWHSGLGHIGLEYREQEDD